MGKDIHMQWLEGRFMSMMCIGGAGMGGSKALAQDFLINRAIAVNGVHKFTNSGGFDHSTFSHIID